MVISWQLLRHAEVAIAAMATTDERPFYEGKLAAARWFVRHSAPQVTARRALAEAEDGASDGSRRRGLLRTSTQYLVGTTPITRAPEAPRCCHPDR